MSGYKPIFIYLFIAYREKPFLQFIGIPDKPAISFVSAHANLTCSNTSNSKVIYNNKKLVIEARQVKLFPSGNCVVILQIPSPVN